MTRPTLERFIAAHGIIDASIFLGRGPHQLERWRNGQDVIPEAVTNWLAADPAIVSTSSNLQDQSPRS